MGAVLLRAASLAFIIGIGIFLNERRMVAADAGDVIKKIMIHITLPAAIIAILRRFLPFSPRWLLWPFWA